MNRRALIVLGVLAVLAGGYGLGRMHGGASAAEAPAQALPGAAPAGAGPGAAVRASATAPRTRGSLPAPGMPLRMVFAQLQARADAGDVAAATRLYRDLHLCHLHAGLSAGTARFADDVLAEDTAAMTAPQLADYRSQLDAIEAGARSVARFRTLCDGLDASRLHALVPMLELAARLGEPDARACYLDRGPLADPRGALARPDLLATYRQRAPALVDAGLEAGDWRVVEQLRQATAPGARSLLSAAIDASPEQHYRYLRLHRLGGGARIDTDRALALAARPLTPAQIAQADAWAERTFRHAFAGKPIDADGPLWDPCVFPYE